MYLTTSRAASVMFVLVCGLWTSVDGDGVMLIYRPSDVSNDCAQSRLLRYDVSFGMGMSDTITLVFRTLSDVDYECTVEIATNDGIFLLVVIMFPNNVLDNCYLNSNSLKIIKKNKYVPICSLITQYNARTPYFKAVVKQRFRFRFSANSSVNANLNAHVYQVTVTAARAIPERSKCQEKNETLCTMHNQRFCFTSGVVCDGIKNCGTTDWYDECRVGCGLPTERLSAAAVAAVAAAMLLALLAAARGLARCLPPLADSFFIFNANEDNRLRLDPLLKPPEHSLTELPTNKRISLIPMCLSSSDEDLSEKDSEDPERDNVQFALTDQQKQRMTVLGPNCKTTTVLGVAARLQERFRSITGRGEPPGRRSGPQSQLELNIL